jgi:hypothetical protein
LPYLEQQIWRDLRDNPDFVLMTIAEAEPAKLRKFMKQGNYTFPVISDIESEIPTLFEASAVPTHFVINGEGEIVDYQRGFSPKMFAMLKNSIQKELASLEKKEPPKSAPTTKNKNTSNQPSSTFDFLKTEIRPTKKP